MLLTPTARLLSFTSFIIQHLETKVMKSQDDMQLRYKAKTIWNYLLIILQWIMDDDCHWTASYNHNCHMSMVTIIDNGCKYTFLKDYNSSIPGFWKISVGKVLIKCFISKVVICMQYRRNCVNYNSIDFPIYLCILNLKTINI